MWRVIRFVAGALVLLLAASRGSAQQSTDVCNTCDIDIGSVTIHTLPCLPANPGSLGNTNCRTRIEPTGGTSGIGVKVSCFYAGDACFSRQVIGTYQAFRTAWNVFGVFLSDSGISGFSGWGSGCCAPDGTDWCGVWGMPAGCT